MFTFWFTNDKFMHLQTTYGSENSKVWLITLVVKFSFMCENVSIISGCDHMQGIEFYVVSIMINPLTPIYA